MSDDRTAYTCTAIALHWVIFGLLLCAWGLGVYMVGLPLSPQKLKYFSWHKWLGVTIFGIAVVRLTWRMTHPPPRLPDVMPKWQRRTAGISHCLMYLLILVIPLSGWVYSSASGVPVVYFGVLALPDLVEKNQALAHTLQQIHIFLNFTLFVVASAHIAAAFKHQLVDRDGVLARMLPFLDRR